MSKNQKGIDDLTFSLIHNPLVFTFHELHLLKTGLIEIFTNMWFIPTSHSDKVLNCYLPAV